MAIHTARITLDLDLQAMEEIKWKWQPWDLVLLHAAYGFNISMASTFQYFGLSAVCHAFLPVKKPSEKNHINTSGTSELTSRGEAL